MAAGRVAGRVAGKKLLGSFIYLTVYAPGWRGARPGQFALLQAEPSRCFLPRAFSVAGQTREAVSFLIAPVGDGTRELCGLRDGDELWITGPLGNGFDIEALCDPLCRRIVIVGGGVGIAPFAPLLDRLAQEMAGRGADKTIAVAVLMGFRDALQAEGAKMVREAASRLGGAGVSCVLVEVAEDGSSGPAQKVTEVLARELRRGDWVLACGPHAMLEATWELCRNVGEVRTWFSLETFMACGVGSCHGCVVDLADGSLARVCHDGPVFPGDLVYGRSSP